MRRVSLMYYSIFKLAVFCMSFCRYGWHNFCFQRTRFSGSPIIVSIVLLLEVLDSSTDKTGDTEGVYPVEFENSKFNWQSERSRGDLTPAFVRLHWDGTG